MSRRLRIELSVWGNPLRGTEGYVSLAFTALLYAIPFMPGPRTFKEAIGVPILILALALGLRRIGATSGGERAAARISLTVLCLTMLVSFLMLGHEFCRGLPTSR